MKAFYATGYGDLSVMTYGDFPLPSVRNGEVLVQVKAASINPVDWKVRSGELRFITGFSFPKILGTDFAGVIIDVGRGAAGFKLNDRVYGTSSVVMRRSGTLTEQLSVATGSLRLIPESLSFEQAASLPVAALTALNGLRRSGQLHGRHVLVNGASGGVGHFVVQIAKAKGAKVTGVCSAKNAGFVRSLGADEVLDYRTMDLRGRKFDVLFDAFGHLDLAIADSALADGGIYLTTTMWPATFMKAMWRELTGKKRFLAANMRGRSEDYQELERLLTSGAIKPHIGKIFSLASAHQAFEALEQGGVAGKIILTIN
jgi:NADPH:quinone reductase-like Zn-dependent oxidoreductase